VGYAKILSYMDEFGMKLSYEFVAKNLWIRVLFHCGKKAVDRETGRLYIYIVSFRGWLTMLTVDRCPGETM
jgi:hypothetical protein